MAEMVLEDLELKGIKFSLRHDGKEVGRARIYLIKNDLDHDGRPYALFEDLFVDPNYRGMGYGTQLIKKVIESAKENKCYKIIGTSRYAREAVHSMYEKYGFKDYGKEFRMDLE